MATNRSNLEYDYRDLLIDTIEAYTGSLLSVNYSEISTDDLFKLFHCIVHSVDERYSRALNLKKDLEKIL